MLKLTGIKSKFIYGAMVKSLSFLAHCLTCKKFEQEVQNDFRVTLALSPFFPFRLSCTSTDQAQICNDACNEESAKCIEVECENDITDAGCITINLVTSCLPLAYNTEDFSKLDKFL